MKKIITHCAFLCIAYLLSSYLAYGQQKDLSVYIKLHWGSNDSVFLYSHHGKSLEMIAKERMTNGRSLIRVPSSIEPDFYFLRIGKFKEAYPLFVSSGKIDIVSNMALWPKLNVIGSPSHKDYQNYHRITDSLEIASKKLYGEYTVIKDTLAKSALEKKLIETIKTFEKKQFDFVIAHPNSHYSPVVINNAKWDWKMKRDAYMNLSTSIKTSKYGRILNENIAKKKKETGVLEIGDIVPDFEAPKPDKSILSLQKEISNNKLTLIDFWASWCAPCRLENPNLVNLYNQNKNKGFDILGISLDEKDNDWKQAIAKDSLSWTQVSDLKGWSSPIVKLYFSSTPFNYIPQNFIVDSNGKILARNLRGEKLNKKITELLNEGSL